MIDAILDIMPIDMVTFLVCFGFGVLATLIFILWVYICVKFY